MILYCKCEGNKQVDTASRNKISDFLEISGLEYLEVADFCDYFVLCNGTSDRMLDGLADDLLRKIKTSHKLKGHMEGQARDGWLLVDYGEVIVHLFSPDQREYYALEELWGEGKALVHIQ